MTNDKKTYIPSWFQRKRLFDHVCLNCGRVRKVPYDRWIMDSKTLRMCGSTCIKAFWNWTKRAWDKRPLGIRKEHPQDWNMVKAILAKGGTVHDVAEFLAVSDTSAADYIAREVEKESCLRTVRSSPC